jgi:hypothetical protein
MFSSDLQAASLARQERCLDLARKWLSLCSAESCRSTVERFSELTDEQLANQRAARWHLDQAQGDENDFTWFERHGANKLMLAYAFGVARQRLIPASKQPLNLSEGDGYDRGRGTPAQDRTAK